MILYKLIAIILTIDTGSIVSEYEEIQKPMSLQRCIEKQSQMPAEHPHDGKIKVYECRQVEIV